MCFSRGHPQVDLVLDLPSHVDHAPLADLDPMISSSQCLSAGPCTPFLITLLPVSLNKNLWCPYLFQACRDQGQDPLSAWKPSLLPLSIFSWTVEPLLHQLPVDALVHQGQDPLSAWKPPHASTVSVHLESSTLIHIPANLLTLH